MDRSGSFVPHQQTAVLTLLRKECKKRNKPLEEIIGQWILMGRRYGRYGIIRRQIIDEIDELCRLNFISISDEVYNCIWNVLHYENQGYITDLKWAVFNKSRKINYVYFRKSSSCFQIKIIDTKENILKILKTFEEGNSTVRYVDCEKSHYNLRPGPEKLRRLAAITVCDPPSKTVFIFRVHELSLVHLNHVRDAFLKISQHHNFVSFGDEEIMTVGCGTYVPIRCRNVQPYDHTLCPLSLKEVAGQRGIIVEKTQAMSDWTAETLTNDQVQYAAMDAYVLYEMSPV